MSATRCHKCGQPFPTPDFDCCAANAAPTPEQLAREYATQKTAHHYVNGKLVSSTPGVFDPDEYDAHLDGQRVGFERVLALLRSDKAERMTGPFIPHERQTGEEWADWLEKQSPMQTELREKK